MKLYILVERYLKVTMAKGLLLTYWKLVKPALSTSCGAESLFIFSFDVLSHHVEFKALFNLHRLLFYLFAFERPLRDRV